MFASVFYKSVEQKLSAPSELIHSSDRNSDLSGDGRKFAKLGICGLLDKQLWMSIYVRESVAASWWLCIVVSCHVRVRGGRVSGTIMRRHQSATKWRGGQAEPGFQV